MLGRARVPLAAVDKLRAEHESAETGVRALALG
jgi:hypothetical protein